MTLNNEPIIEMYDKPITRKQTYTSLPRPIPCGRCNEVAYCKVMHDLGEVIKVEYLCRSCCGEVRAADA